MTTSRFLGRRYISLFRGLVCGALCIIAALAADGSRRSYDIPAGEAAVVIRRFAEISGREVLFVAEVVRGVRTSPLRGEFTAPDALRVMLAGTELVVMQDEGTNALAIRRKPSNESSPPANTKAKTSTRSALSEAADDADEPVRLSVFEVSSARDIGYRAGTTVAGSRTGEELKNVPQTITVFTQDFIKDTGATDSLSAMDYAIGGGFKPVNSFDVNRFVFRGVINNFQSRNFNVWYIPSDSFSTDRIDVVRGPNSILFGEGDPGGMMNINTKQAGFRSVTTLGVRVGSWDQIRATADVNRQLGPSIAVRLNLVFDERDNWQRWVGHRRTGAHLAGTLRAPNGSSQLRYEGEYGLYTRRVPQVLPQDQFSFWNGTTPFAFNAATGPAGTQRLSSATGANFWIWDHSVGALRDWRGFGQTGGLSVVQSSPVKDTALFARGNHFFGPSLAHNFEFNSHALVAEHRIGPDLTLQLEGSLTIDTNYRQQTTENLLRRDPNAALPTGAANPRFGAAYLEYQWQIQRAHHYMPAGRLSGVYDWKPAAWMQQRFFGNVASRLERFNSTTQRETIVNNPAVPSLNQAAVQVRRRVYLADGDRLQNVGTFQPVKDAATGLQSDYTTTQGLALTDLVVSNLQLNASGQYFGGRFRTLVGGRRDYFRAYNTAAVRNPANGLNDRTGQPMLLANKGYNTSHTAGAIWQATPWLSFYGLASTSFRARAASTARIDGAGLGPQLGKGREAGLRLDLAEGKLYVQTSVFDLDQTQRAIDHAGTVNTINAIWTNPSANTVRPGYTNNALTQGTFDTDALNSKGWEIETWLNLVAGWTLQGGYSFSEPRSTDVSPVLRAYIAGNLAGWQQLAASDAATGAAINASIATLQNFLASQVAGTRTLSANRHSFSLFTKYAVKSGALQGFEIGGGVNYRSGSVLENRLVGGVLTPRYGDTSTVVNALVGYRRRIGRDTRWNLSLNVQNLLGHDYFVETNGISNSNYGEPRSWALTSTFGF